MAHNVRNQSVVKFSVWGALLDQVNNVKHLWPKRRCAFCIYYRGPQAYSHLKLFSPYIIIMLVSGTHQHTDPLWVNLRVCVRKGSSGQLGGKTKKIEAEKTEKQFADESVARL